MGSCRGALDVSALLALEELDLPGQGLTGSVDLRGLSNLRRVNLQDNRLNSVPNSDRVSGKIEGTSCHVEYGVDYVGPDIRSQSGVIDELGCCAECHAETGCVMWAYSPSQQLCWLKSGAISNADRITGRTIDTSVCDFPTYIVRYNDLAIAFDQQNPGALSLINAETWGRQEYVDSAGDAQTRDCEPDTAVWDCDGYVARYADLSPLAGDCDAAFAHYVKEGRAQGRSGGARAYDTVH